jgi:ATP-dependent helicase HrpA
VTWRGGGVVLVVGGAVVVVAGAAVVVVAAVVALNPGDAALAAGDSATAGTSPPAEAQAASPTASSTAAHVPRGPTGHQRYRSLTARPRVMLVGLVDADLDRRLAALLVRDEHRLRRQLERGRRADIDAELAAAEDRAARRRASVPTPSYPTALPVVERRDDVLAALRDHQVVVVAGETGSGKSTQLPKLCLDAGRGLRGFIGHTQPRRIAARAVAERVAEELGTDVGGQVGYAVRFTQHVSDDTLVKVMTDGILLAEVQRDPLLLAYDTLLVDEAHERSLNVDFLLGYLKRLLPDRPDLHVVITSATIDTARFAAHFDGAPVVEVSGRTFGVEVRYQPIGEDPGDDRDQIQAICDAVEELAEEGPGDVLVFLSGEREIRDAAEAIGRLDLPRTEVLPLYARLSAAEQHRVFQSHPGRRIVLATNVAETSLTVPGIRYVVDPGTARISRYNRRTKVQRLPIEAISRASADQRAGRCGRVAPGICIRLYSEEDLAGRPEFTEPEILRTNLASVILQMTALGLGDVAAFPFLDPPDARSVADGVALLRELGALDERRLTPIGRRLAQLPVDPRIGRMVLEADRNGCVAEVLVLAAALSIQDPRERPLGQEQEAAALHARFTDPDSDFLAYLNLWRYLAEEQASRSSNQFRRLCRREHLHHLRVREWQDVHGQLRQITRALRIRAGDAPAAPDAIHRSLLAGLLSQIGAWNRDKQEYDGTRGARFAIAAGSALARKRPRWVMAAELVETNRMWARTVARIQPGWVESLGAHLVVRSHGEPWWDAARGTAMVHERVTLHGLTLVPARAIPYGRVDPADARAMFVQHALVEDDWDSPLGFVARNRAVLDEVRALEDRLRRRDLLVGTDELFAWYDARLPEHVTTARHFDRWWRDEHERRPDLLDLTVDDAATARVDPTGHPVAWLQGDLELPLTYVFDVDSELDGVTVDIPVDVLNRITSDGFDWQVPGLRADLVTALIRSLPKPVRRSFVPVPEHVAAFLASATPADGPLLEALTRHLTRTTGDPIPPGSWRPEEVPPHLRMTFRAADDRGRPLAWSKDLAALQDRLRPRVRAAIAGTAPSIERAGVQDWDLGALPRVVEAQRDGRTVKAYPALVDEGGSVAVRVLPSEAEQAAAMWAGTRRLLQLGLPAGRRQLARLLPRDAQLALATAHGGLSVGAVLDDCVTAAVDVLLADAGGPAWDAESFAELRQHVADGFTGTAVDVTRSAAEVIAVARTVEERLVGLTAPLFRPAADDVAAQLRRLVHPSFVTAAGATRLPDVRRYLRAAERRLDKLAESPGRDRALMDRVHALESHPRAEAVRWQLEELRVSLFAQSLGTAHPVSEQRIRRLLESAVDLRSMT